jgi:hypothetical protein
MSKSIYKYPRTPHIEGSCKQQGDEDIDDVPFRMIANQEVIIEEKVDGANAGISFNESGKMLLQSRGHYLTGGYRERQFNLFKQWAYSNSLAFQQVLGKYYILYGEWLYAKHTIFYNNLPHYFLAFDVFDKDKEVFFDTEKRQNFLKDLHVVSVPILYRGKIKSAQNLVSLITQSNFINSGHLEQLRTIARAKELDEELILQQTDNSTLMEGLFVKIEENGTIKNRYKYVRHSFSNTIIQSEIHWLNRPLIPNLLANNVSLFTESPKCQK